MTLVVLVAPATACTVLNDLDGYSGGKRDTGASIVDTGAIDTAVPDTGDPPEDTGVEPDTTPVVDTTVADSTIDAVATDSDSMDVADTAEAAVDTATPDAPLDCHPVINEIQTRSVATGLDEFIELYNPCSAAISLAGWKLVYRSSAGATESVLIPAFAATASIASKGFFLTANATGAFAAMADATFTSGIADVGGVALRDTAGAIADSVTWGAVAASHPFTETATAPEPSSGASIARQPLGADTNDNSADFKKLATATPKAE